RASDARRGYICTNEELLILTTEFSFCLCLLPLSKMPGDVILAPEADWELNAGRSIMAHRKFATRPAVIGPGVSVFPDVGGFTAHLEVLARRREEIDHLGVFSEPSLVLRIS